MVSATTATIHTSAQARYAPVGAVSEVKGLALVPNNLPVLGELSITDGRRLWATSRTPRRASAVWSSPVPQPPRRAR
jgi:hypothetical protein